MFNCFDHMKFFFNVIDCIGDLFDLIDSDGFLLKNRDLFNLSVHGINLYNFLNLDFDFFDNFLDNRYHDDFINLLFNNLIDFNYGRCEIFDFDNLADINNFID